MKNFIIAALAVLCVVLLFRSCGRQTERIVERRDTTVVVRVDTVRFVDVVYRDRWQVRVDTLRVFASELLTRGDSVAVPVPIDTYIFTDDTTYRAQVSGYNVSMDRMEVFRKSTDRIVTVDRTIVSKPRRFGLGLQVGYGINTSGELRP
ncbi:MAG: hypothetical protein RSB32_08165, partial [Mucinivorans sp.]